MEAKDEYVKKLLGNAELVYLFKKTTIRKFSEIMEHQAVKEMLVKMEILTVEDDFTSVYKNKNLMEALKLMLIINSSVDVDHSINPTHFTRAKKLHPSKYVSDFNLIVTFETKEHFKTFNNERAKTSPESLLTEEELNHYWVNVRRTLKTEFTEMRNTMVYNFGLDGRFDLNEKVPKPKTPKTPKLKTPEEVYISVS
jgi:hypothetical protein